MADRAKHLEEPAAAARGMAQKPDQTQQVYGSAPSPVLQPRSVRVPPTLNRPADILMLQQTIGNRAVMRLLDKERSVVQAKGVENSEEESVQLQTEGQREPSNAEIHAAAARGISTPATTLPFLDRIQASFGRHSIGHIKAHVGPEAAKSARDMNALAYASGDHVVFGGPPDLHTAAHEAAHVVQQKAGVQLTGGVGCEGDAYELHADTVADAVEGGRSAEGLLDPFMAPPAADPSKPAEHKATACARGSDIHIGPGLDEHLQHEARHVTQQKQDRVRRTTQTREISINSNKLLKADVMGGREARQSTKHAIGHGNGSRRMHRAPLQHRNVIQFLKTGKVKEALEMTEAGDTHKIRAVISTQDIVEIITSNIDQFISSEKDQFNLLAEQLIEKFGKLVEATNEKKKKEYRQGIRTTLEDIKKVDEKRRKRIREVEREAEREAAMRELSNFGERLRNKGVNAELAEAVLQRSATDGYAIDAKYPESEIFALRKTWNEIGKERPYPYTYLLNIHSPGNNDEVVYKERGKNEKGQTVLEPTISFIMKFMGRNVNIHVTPKGYKTEYR